MNRNLLILSLAASLTLSAPAAAETKTRTVTAFSQTQLSFETNAGQAAGDVKYISRGPGYSLVLTPGEATLRISDPKTGKQTKELRMQLAYGPSAPVVEGLDDLPGRANYFVGRDPSKWTSGVARYARVRYRNVYPGIDVVFYGNQHRLEYDLIVAPGADLSALVWKFPGARKITVNANGDLVVRTASGETEQSKPMVYQESAGERKPIACNYVLKGSGAVGFALASFDAAKPLVIDPTIVLTQYIGGSAADNILGSATDSAGNIYVVGSTSSTDFPVTGGIQKTLPGTSDCFITKLSPGGASVIYSTYLGGSAADAALGVAVDSAGNAYITGTTSSANFPLVSPLQTAFPAPNPPYAVQTGFVSKLNASGSALIYSTYYGGIQASPTAIAVDSTGAVYVTGSVGSGLPTVNPEQAASAGSTDAFVSKMNPAGTALVFSTYLGGGKLDIATAIGLDSTGNIYIAGHTNSIDFPTASPLQAANAGGTFDAFVSELNPAGNTLLFSTYLGGTGSDQANGLAVGSDNSVYVVGSTASTNFPVSNAFQATYGGGSSDGFITKILPPASGSAVIGDQPHAGAVHTTGYSTYSGGLGADNIFAAILDPKTGDLVAVSSTQSTNFPLLNPLQSTLPAYQAGAISILNSSGQLVFSSFTNLQGPSFFQTVSVDQAETIWAAGSETCAASKTTCKAGDTNGVLQGVTLSTTQPTCTYSIPSGKTYDASAESDSFDVITVPATGCVATPKTSDSFITDLSEAGEDGSEEEVTFSITMNNTGNTRVGHISVANQVFTVTQLACTYSISPASGTFSAAGGNDSFGVISVPPDGCQASPTTSDSFITDIGAAGDEEGEEVNFAITPNNTGKTRVGHISIANQAFTVTQLAPPLPTEGGAVGAASANTLVGAAIGALYGTCCLATGTAQASTTPLPVTLGGSTVAVTSSTTGSINAPLFFVSDGQINFQMPWEFIGQSQVTLTVTTLGVASAPITVNLSNPSPGIFTVNGQGTGQGIILISNTASYAAPANSIPGAQATPAQAGNYLTIYCTGLGDVNNRPADGAATPVNSLATTLATPTVTLGGINAPVAFSGLTPNEVSLYQVNVQVPAGITPGNAVPVVIKIGGAVSNTVTIAVQ